MHASRSPARPRPPPRRALRGDMSDNRDAFRRVAIDRVTPAADAASAFLFECAARLRAPFSPRSRRLVRQHVVRRAPRPAPCRRLALRLLVRHDARCVGPTSAFSRSSYEYPRLVGSRCVAALARLARSGRSPASRQCDSLRWAARACRAVIAVGVVVPVAMRADRTSDIPVASPAGARPLARHAHTVESRRDRPQPARVNDASWSSDPRCLPSSKDLCPATPSRAPGSGLPRARGLATAIPVLDALFTPAGPCGARREARSPSTRPVANGRHASLDLRRRLPTSAT